MKMGLVPQEVGSDSAARAPAHSDAETIAHLMIDTYRGTADDQGETLEMTRGNSAAERREVHARRSAHGEEA